MGWWVGGRAWGREGEGLWAEIEFTSLEGSPLVTLPDECWDCSQQQHGQYLLCFVS